MPPNQRPRPGFITLRRLREGVVTAVAVTVDVLIQERRDDPGQSEARVSPVITRYNYPGAVREIIYQQ